MRSLCTISVLLIVTLAASACAQVPPEQHGERAQTQEDKEKLSARIKSRIDKLVGQFAADEQKQRETAAVELGSLLREAGEKEDLVAKYLQERLRESDNLEVRYHIFAVLEKHLRPWKYFEPLHKLKGHSNWVFSARFSPDGRLLASASRDRTIRIWDPRSGECLRTLTGHKWFVYGPEFSPDSNLLASCSLDKTVRIWNPHTGECLRKLTGHEGAVSSVSFSPDGKLLASASHDKTIRMWNPVTGECLRTLKVDVEHGILSVVFSPDGKLLTSGSIDGSIHIHDLQSGRCIHTLGGHKGSVREIAFSPDGELLASAGGDNTIRIWGSKTGECLRTLAGHDSSVSSVAFSPDGRWLLSGSSDCTARIWNPHTGEYLRRLKVHPSFVNSVAFSPDGWMLASASGDETIAIWGISEEKIEAEFKRYLRERDKLTHQEFRKMVERLLKAMSAEDYRKREKATAQLEKLTEENQELLIFLMKKRGEVKDVEVKHRLDEILKPVKKWEVTAALLRDFPDILKKLESGKSEDLRRVAWKLGRMKHEDGFTVLLKLLKHQDNYAASAAARGLGKLKDKRAIEPLIEALKTPVRISAALALGEIGDRRAVEPLIKALRRGYRRGDTTHKFLTKALGDIGDKRAIEPLRELWQKNKRVDVKTAVAYALAKLAADEGAFEFLLKTVREGGRYISEPAGEALSEIADKRVVEPLIEILKQDNQFVRRAAAQALGGIGDAKAVKPLIEALGDKDWFVRYLAAIALGEIGDETAIGPLIEVLKKDKDARGGAAEALVGIGKASVEPLKKVWQEDKDKKVKVYAAYAVAKITGDKSAFEFLIGALNDSDHNIRRFTARVVEKLQDSRIIEALIEALKDNFDHVRGAAAYALRKLTLQDFGEDYKKWKQWYEEEKKE